MRLIRRLFIPDCHFPSVDERAWNIMLDCLTDFKPHEIILLGDFDDVYCVSSYEKSPDKDFLTLEEELESGRKAKQQIQAKAKGAQIISLAGNHEHRIQTYLKHSAPRLWGSIDFRKLLGIPQGWIFLPYGQENYWRMGKLTATHGTITGKFATSKMIEKLGCSIVHGHTHHVQEYHIRNLRGEQFVGISPGWLGDMKEAAEYIKDIANWAQGFAITLHKPNGDFFHQIIHIKNGEAYFDGKIYR